MTWLFVLSVSEICECPGKASASATIRLMDHVGDQSVAFETAKRLKSRITMAPLLRVQLATVVEGRQFASSVAFTPAVLPTCSWLRFVRCRRRSGVVPRHHAEREAPGHRL